MHLFLRDNCRVHTQYLYCSQYKETNFHTVLTLPNIGISLDKIAKELTFDDMLSMIETKIHPLRKGIYNQIEQELDEYPRVDRKHIKLLTYNVFLRGGGIGSLGSNIDYYLKSIKFEGGEYKEERLKAFQAFTENFDIICFQEIFSCANSRKQTMTAYLAKAGFFDCYHMESPTNFERFVSCGGISIYSRFPILEKSSITFNKFTSLCVPAKKGAIYAKILIDGKILHLFNAHFQANYPK